MNSKNITSGFTPFEYKEFLDKGIGYSQYKKQMGENLAESSDVKLQNFIYLNQQRMVDVEMNYTVSDSLALFIKNINQKIFWLVITEHWCGDSSQSLPVFNKFAELSEGKIEMRIVYRDQYPEPLNVVPTTFSRIMPKIIQLDGGLNVTGVWGPCPSGAIPLKERKRLKNSAAASHDKKLHDWYANDHQDSIESEIIVLLTMHNFNVGIFNDQKITK